MPESPLLFSSVVPACGSCLQLQSRSRGVKVSRSGRPKARHMTRAAGRKVAEGSPTSRLLNFSTSKSGEQSENVYENKGRSQDVEKPLTRLATLATLSPGRGLLTRFIREPEVMPETRKSGEQSENVYENKGREQKVARSYSAIPNADSMSSGRRSEGGGWFPQRLDSSTSRLQNRGNKARMSMKTKDKYKMSLSSQAAEK